MFKITGKIEEILIAAKDHGSAPLPFISPAENPAAATLFFGKGYTSGFSRIEIDFYPTRWDISSEGKELLSVAGFSPRQTGVKKEDIPEGKEKEWLQILAGILTVDGMFVTRSNFV